MCSGVCVCACVRPRSTLSSMCHCGTIVAVGTHSCVLAWLRTCMCHTHRALAPPLCVSLCACLLCAHCANHRHTQTPTWRRSHDPLPTPEAEAQLLAGVVEMYRSGTLPGALEHIDHDPGVRGWVCPRLQQALHSRSPMQVESCGSVKCAWGSGCFSVAGVRCTAAVCCLLLSNTLTTTLVGVAYVLVGSPSAEVVDNKRPRMRYA